MLIPTVTYDNFFKDPNLILDYAKTLADWRTKFLAAWSELTQFGYDEEFKRLWLYYFAYCEGAFLERSISTVHMVARK